MKTCHGKWVGKRGWPLRRLFESKDRTAAGAVLGSGGDAQIFLAFVNLCSSFSGLFFLAINSPYTAWNGCSWLSDSMDDVGDDDVLLIGGDISPSINKRQKGRGGD